MVLQSIQHGTFYGPNIYDDVHRGGKIDQWITHQLTGTVPCNGSGTIRVNNWSRMVNDVVVLRVATRRVSGFSFKDQTCIWVLAADNPGVQLTLQRIHGGIRFQAGIKKIYDMHNINLTTLSRL